MMDKNEAMWYTALATFGVGDLATTHVGLQERGIVETNPFADTVLQGSGTAGLVGLKVLAFTTAGIAYGSVSEDYRVGIPIGLSLLGTYATVRNIHTIIEGRKARDEL